MTSPPRQDGRVALEEGIKLSDLLQGGDVMFSVKSDFSKIEEYEAPEDIFNEDEIIRRTNLDVVVEDEYADTPFEAIKAKMTKVTPSGTVMKRVLQGGIGDIIPADALVRINYDGYFEFNEVPFDSTTLRGKAEEFIVGSSGLVIGLDIAVGSMRNRERAEFILQPSVAYGKIGCPPRIPANAEVLFVIEVMSWRLGSEAAVARALTNERGEKEWEPCKNAVAALIKEGITFYDERRYKDSKIKLEKAKHFLERCHLKDEAEEKEQKKFMYKVSLNLSMVLNQMQGHASFAPLAIINCKDALKIDPQSGKAELQWGIALITLGELDEARKHLKAAKRLMPSSALVDETLEKLETKVKKQLEVEKKQWKRVFSPDEKPAESKVLELSPEAQDILEALKDFQISPDQEMVLPSGMTVKEKEIIQDLASKLNLVLTMRPSSICISKQ